MFFLAFQISRGNAVMPHSTVSQSHLKQVQHYIANQKEHHRKVSFRDEFINFLKVNGIEYDERYI